jgi:hypothetical protein
LDYYNGVTNEHLSKSATVNEELKIPLHNTSPASADGARKIGKYKEGFIFNERESKIINVK